MTTGMSASTMVATTQTIEDIFARVVQQSMYYQGDVAAKLIASVNSIDAAIEVG